MSRRRRRWPSGATDSICQSSSLLALTGIVFSFVTFPGVARALGATVGLSFRLRLGLGFRLRRRLALALGLLERRLFAAKGRANQFVGQHEPRLGHIPYGKVHAGRGVLVVAR